MHACIVAPLYLCGNRGGGIRTHTELFSRLLIKIGVRVTLFTTTDSSDLSEKMIDGMRVIPVLQLDKPSVTKKWNEELKFCFTAVAEKETIDCVFSQNYWAYGLLNEVQKRKIPIITIVHNFHLVHFYNLTKEIESLRNFLSYLIKSIPQLIYKIFKYELLFYHRSRFIISVSSKNARLLNKIYFIPKDKICELHNWVATDEFSPSEESRQKLRAKLELSKDVLVFLLAGYLWRPKGFIIALRSFARLIQVYPDAMLFVAGEGPQEEYLKKMSGGNGLKGKIKFLGYVPHNELPQLYNGADIFLMPSIISEGCPYALIEAMACGLATIASKRGGNIEILAEAGILVSAGNINSLTEAMLKLAKAPLLRIEKSHLAREKALRYFSEEIANRILSGLLREIVPLSCGTRKRLSRPINY